MAGYYDEITGDWIDTGDVGQIQDPLGLDNTSGTRELTDSEGTPWQYNNGIWTSPAGQTYDMSYLPSGEAASIRNALARMGGDAASGLLRAFTNRDGSTNWRNVTAALGGLYGLYQSNRPQEKTGYQGKIPSYTAVREAVPGSQYDPTRRPGSGGQRYFSDVKYVAPTDAEAMTAARAAAKEEAAGLEALNRGNPAREGRAATEEAAAKGEESQQVREGTDASDVIKTVPVPKYAYGGIANLNKGRYLNGSSDGMADKIPANIDGAQEARLSHGEFVIPADVVSHLGNGNSEAGAQRLYTMMDRIRKARTGTAKQGKQITPNKFLPA